MPTRPKTLGQLKAEKRGESVRAQHDRHYDAQRDPKLRAFYGSQRWKEVRAFKVKRAPLCEPCEAKGKTTPTAHVHHINKVKTHWGQRYAIDNLLSVCTACHAEVERESQ